MPAGRHSVLIVDDSPANVRLLGSSLSDRYEVLVSLSGSEALRIAAEQRPDIILLDVVMPGMDGMQVCRLLKADPETRHIPIIFVTSLDEEAEEERGLALGAIDYLTKPIRPAIVRARVQNQLERERLIQDLRKALADIETLSGLIPVCAWCRKVRDDAGFWERFETFVSERSKASFTHSICPDCDHKLEAEEAARREAGHAS